MDSFPLSGSFVGKAKTRDMDRRTACLVVDLGLCSEMTPGVSVSVEGARLVDQALAGDARNAGTPIARWPMAAGSRWQITGDGRRATGVRIAEATDLAWGQDSWPEPRCGSNHDRPVPLEGTNAARQAESV